MVSYVTHKILRFPLVRSTIFIYHLWFWYYGSTAFESSFSVQHLFLNSYIFLLLFLSFYFSHSDQSGSYLGVTYGYNYNCLSLSLSLLIYLSTYLSTVGQLSQSDILNISSFPTIFKLCLSHCQFAFELQSTLGYCIMSQ